MPPRLTDEARTKILNLLASGLNIKQAAKEVGSSPGTVARIKHQADEALAKASRKARGLVAVAPPPNDDDVVDAEMPECTDCIALYERVGRLVVENERLKRILAGR